MASNPKISYIIIAVLLVTTVIFAFKWQQASGQPDTASLSLCKKNNACQSRTPGSGFRCDADENFVAGGEYWCECNNSCNVERQAYR